MAKTLLLADDSVTIQKVVGISLASEDIVLVTVDNGDDAIARARELRPDAILADCVMPGRSGYEVCEQIQADPVLRHIPVLLLTGTFEAFDEERATRCGAAGHIAKPFEAQTLIEEVQRLFTLAASRRPALVAPARPPARPVAASMGAAAAAPRAPAPRPTRPPIPPAAPAVPVAVAVAEPDDAGESFDFFEEDLDDLLPAELADDGDLGAGDEIALDSSESPFAFGSSSQPSLREAPRTPARGAERTVAILPEVPIGRAERAPAPQTIGERDLARLHDETSRPGRTAPERTLLMTEGLDFDLGAPAEDDSALRLSEGDLGGATVLDPQAAGSFDVSASDLLGDPLAVEAPVAERIQAAAPPLRPTPMAPAISLELIEPEPEPPPPPDFPEDRSLLAEVEPVRRPSADEEVQALARSALDSVGPRLLTQLHETLEKVAWESLSDVTDQIVRHAVERIEAIAWEVIPQMAETMIREEIRRMKDEEGS